MRWHLLLSPPLDGVDNMALDEALMSRARRQGDGVVRVYSWRTPTLSLGRNQRAQGVYTSERARLQQVALVRRATGGRALLHHREITYSVTAPAADQESLAASYRAINALLVTTLHRLGIGASIAERAERLAPPESAPCFERPAPGELVLRGRKLVGSAQYRESGAMLQHGSVLVHDDQALVVTLAEGAVGAVAPAATLADELGRDLSPTEFADALFEVVRDEWDATAKPIVVDAALRADQEVARQRYISDAWTWRR